MASANLELVQSITAAWERGDFSSAEWAHPEIQFSIVGGLDPGRWKGLAGMAEGWRDFLSAWEEWHNVVDEFRELDGERVLVLLHFSARGKASGLDADQIRTKGATLFHVRGGKVTRLSVYMDSELALAELGIAPEDGSTLP